MRELVLVLLVALVRAEDQGVYITQTWNGGFHGHFTLKPDHTVHGWTAHLQFSKPVDTVEVWTANIQSHNADKTEYVLTNKNYDGDINAHSELKVDFNGRAPGMDPPTATVSIEGVDSNPGGVVTSAPSGGGGGGGNPITPAPATGQSGSKMKHDYCKAMALSIKFFDAQRSGRLPANNPIPWRGNSAEGDNGDGHDLSGGWYDAGDHVKFNLPMSWSAHVLAWGLEKFKDAYSASGQLDMMYDMLKWPLEYFLKCWEPSKQQYWVQVGDGHADHGYWGRPEAMNMARPAFKITAGAPGSDVAGTTVAALASGYTVFKDKDATFAGKCLEAAKSLYTFAKAHPGIYSNSVPQAKDFYGSSSWKDNMCEGAVELYKATKDNQYLNDAKGWFSSGTAWGYSWDDQNVGCQLLLWEVTQEGQYKAPVEAFVKAYMPGGSVPYTPCGLAWRDQWGANRYAANAAFVATMAAQDGIGGDSYKEWAMTQMNYILGDNNYHMSYEIGFGNKFPKRPHHRGASCTPSYCAGDGQDSPNQLDGAMVGGPGRNDDYQDRRGDYVKNEVACDYNAGFHSAAAALCAFAHQNKLPPSPHSKC